MLSPQLLEMINKVMPNLNPKIGQEIVYHESILKMEEFLENYINNASHGLKYVGWYWLSPEDEIRERAQHLRTFDIEEDHMRMVGIKLEYKNLQQEDLKLFVCLRADQGFQLVADFFDDRLAKLKAKVESMLA